MSENSIESILSMISSNPELVNKISSAVQGGGDDLSKSLSNVISLISENQENAKSSEEKHEKSDTTAIKLEKEDVFSSNDKVDSFISSLSKSIAKNASLLIALKPYLNKNRGDMIDAVVKISKLTSVMNLAR